MLGLQADYERQFNPAQSAKKTFVFASDPGGLKVILAISVLMLATNGFFTEMFKISVATDSMIYDGRPFDRRTGLESVGGGDLP